MPKSAKNAPPSVDLSTVPLAQFDGKKNYIEVGFQEALNPPQFTVECWAKVTGGQGSWRSPVTCRGDRPIAGYILYAGENNKWQFWIGSGSSWSNYQGPAVKLNAWTHCAGSYDGKVMRFYINGEEVGSPVTAPLTLNTCFPLRIGAGCTETSPQFFFHGQIAEVRVWNDVRTPEEIKACMNQRCTGNEVGLIAYWPLSDGAGETAQNRTRPANPGVLHGATWSTTEDLLLVAPKPSKRSYVPTSQTGLQDYSYWGQYVKEEAKKSKGETKFRRGRIWA
jgi:cyanobactin cluster PatC/TenC/TruC protein